MKKGTIAVMMTVAFAAAACFGSIAMAEKTKSGEVPDSFLINNKATFKKLKKAPVKFTHKAHVEKHKVKCAECHHVYKGKKNVWKEGDKVQKCADCHKKKNTKAGGVKIMKLRNAFHKNCQTCHKEAKKGPTKCNECHPKK